MDPPSKGLPAVAMPTPLHVVFVFCQLLFCCYLLDFALPLIHSLFLVVLILKFNLRKFMDSLL